MKFNCDFTITMRPGKELIKRLDRIAALSQDPTPLGHAVRRAAAVSLLREYRKRFTAAVPQLVQPEKQTKRRPVRELSKALRERIDGAQEAVAQAMLDGSRADVRKAQDRLAKAVEATNTRLQNPPENPLSTGEFRPRMWEVIRLLTSVNEMGLSVSKHGVAVGIGPLRALNAIQTPSATELLTGSPTQSQRTSLWRQLEFGTGVYAQPVSKGWRYGRKGLLIRGARGANALRLPESGVGVMNKGDALLFEQALQVELRKLLS